MPQSAPLKFAPVARTYAELEYPPVADYIVTAADHAGVGEGLTQIIIPQIRMSIEVNGA